jgi:hypothetical protein
MKMTVKLDSKTDYKSGNIVVKQIIFDANGVRMYLQDQKDVEILESMGYRPLELELKMKLGDFIDHVNSISQS